MAGDSGGRPVTKTYSATTRTGAARPHHRLTDDHFAYDDNPARSTDSESVGDTRSTAAGNFTDAARGGSAGIEEEPANHGGEIARADGRTICTRTEISVIADSIFEFNGSYRKPGSTHFGWPSEQSHHFSARGDGRDGQPVDYRLRTHHEPGVQ